MCCVLSPSLLGLFMPGGGWSRCQGHKDLPLVAQWSRGISVILTRGV